MSINYSTLNLFPAVEQRNSTMVDIRSMRGWVDEMVGRVTTAEITTT